jgi:L-ribulokinase
MKRYAIGVDFGTLSGRAVLVDTRDGTVFLLRPGIRHGVMEKTLPSGRPLPAEFALHHPADYLDVLDYTIPRSQKRRRPGGEVAAIGVDCTASTVLPVNRDGTPLCFLPEFADEPHAYIHLWKHHAAQPQADRMTEKARERNEKWLAAYGGKVSCEGALPKLWQMLEEAPQVDHAAAYWIEATDWLVWQLCGKKCMSACCAGYKYLYSAPDGYPSEGYFSSLDPRLFRAVREKCALPIAPLFTSAGTLTEDMHRRLGLSTETAVAVA